MKENNILFACLSMYFMLSCQSKKEVKAPSCDIRIEEIIINRGVRDVAKSEIYIGVGGENDITNVSDKLVLINSQYKIMPEWDEHKPSSDTVFLESNKSILNRRLRFYKIRFPTDRPYGLGISDTFFYYESYFNSIESLYDFRRNCVIYRDSNLLMRYYFEGNEVIKNDSLFNWGNYPPLIEAK